MKSRIILVMCLCNNFFNIIENVLLYPNSLSNVRHVLTKSFCTYIIWENTFPVNMIICHYKQSPHHSITCFKLNWCGLILICSCDSWQRVNSRGSLLSTAKWTKAFQLSICSGSGATAYSHFTVAVILLSIS